MTLAEVRTKGGLDVAAGENACTAQQFRQMMDARAVSHAQPSVIKVGGITEYLKVAALADEHGVRLAPHSPYFGPGFLATLQLMSLRDDRTFVEVFYMKRPACLWRGRVDVDDSGNVAVPDGPGLGYEPDPEVMANIACPTRAGPLRAPSCRRVGFLLRLPCAFFCSVWNPDQLLQRNDRRLQGSLAAGSRHRSSADGQGKVLRWSSEKSTLLCRQLVRRSGLFDREISMPGTSWANAPPGTSMQPTAMNVTKTIRPAMKIPSVCSLHAKLRDRAARRQRYHIDTAFIP